MKRFNWNKKIIKTLEDVSEFVTLYNNTHPRVCSLDTETTGLHIIKDKPFVYQFGFVNEETNIGYAYAVEDSTEVWGKFLRASLNSALKAEKLVGSNIKFDLHMLRNIGYRYLKRNVTDTTYYIRWGTDNVPPARGGDLLGIKSFCSKYVYKEAKTYDKLLKVERTRLKRELKREVGYHELRRDLLLDYSLEDIVMTLEGFYKIEPIVHTRSNMHAVELEEDLMWVLLDMERVGFKADKEYLMASKERMETYIEERTQCMYELAGQKLGVGQHAVIKKILQEKFKLNIDSTGKEVLDLMVGSMPKDAAEFIKVIQELRTLNKWLSTYIIRFLDELKDTDTLYTTINQVGAVSGRVSSDFQQFPKKGLKTIDGRELFTPRKMVQVRGGDYDKLVYMDYSQIELRVQALYTILVGHPDLNLCRAYMPYECISETSEEFDYNNPEHIKNWGATWYLKESPGTVWEPTDLHSVTCKNAFGIDETHPEFGTYRSIGKRVNFAKQYGASINQIYRMFPQYDDEQINRIDGAYYKSFPGVKFYHTYCYTVAQALPCVGNLFGINYYGVSGHNLINMLVQGSSATLLKIKLIQCYHYLKANGHKSRIQMNIHDEISFEKHKDDSMDVFLKLKEIMEEWNDSLVPIVADLEVSTTTWAGKEVWHAE
jgi:DNA polymerase-1